jgi:hypothetical protein
MVRDMYMYCILGNKIPKSKSNFEKKNLIFSQKNGGKNLLEQ